MSSTEKYVEVFYSVPDTVFSYEALVEVLKFYAKKYGPPKNENTGIRNVFLINHDQCVVLQDGLTRGGKCPSVKLIIAVGAKVEPQFLADLLQDKRVQLYNRIHSPDYDPVDYADVHIDY